MAGTLSARRTAITPSGPAATRANHMRAMYWNASPSSLIATAPYARRKSRLRRRESAVSGRGASSAPAVATSVVTGSAIARVEARLAAMARTTAVRLTGEDLTLADVWEVAVEHAGVELDESAREKMAAARAVVEEALGAEEPTYGVTTGFGRFVSTRVPGELAEELQLRLLRSHACGVGEPYPEEIVRAAMLMRANALAKGYSGARVDVAELLLECLGRDVIPEVPSRGSVGASGDLAPLAHLALPLVGEGRARVQGELLSGADALAQAGLQPLRLQAKEGLSLVNGTQFMGAFAALGLVRATRLAKTADAACALSVDALQGSRESFLPIDELRPLPGQAASAANILRLLDGSSGRTSGVRPTSGSRSRAEPSRPLSCRHRARAGLPVHAHSRRLEECVGNLRRLVAISHIEAPVT